jgi:hypothetical protein
MFIQFNYHGYNHIIWSSRNRIYLYSYYIYYTDALIVSTILLIITIKKNRFEGEYQLYSRILDARTKI